MQGRIDIASQMPAPSTQLIMMGSREAKLYINLPSIKQFQLLTFDTDAHQHCLALRLRWPPHPTPSFSFSQRALHPFKGTMRMTPPADRTKGTRPLSRCRSACAGQDAEVAARSSARAGHPKQHKHWEEHAFSSPTALLCLHFNSRDCKKEAKRALQSLGIPYIKEKISVDTCMPSMHEGACAGVSHGMPAALDPLTSNDMEVAGDTEYGVRFALDVLLRHGHLRAVDVPRLLAMLQELRGWGVIAGFQTALEEIADALPPVGSCNDGTATMAQVRLHAATTSYI